MILRSTSQLGQGRISRESRARTRGVVMGAGQDHSEVGSVCGILSGPKCQEGVSDDGRRRQGSEAAPLDT